MENSKKKDLIFILSITLFLILYILVITKFGNFFYGSVIDWNCQHYMIPDYFRKLFYETKDIFPDFAMNLGSGQNIYYLSYYGLLNPIILISYLFPNISMKTYLQVSSIITVWVSIILLYKWLKTKFDYKVVVISTILFTLASPLLFHSHRHIMFINYIPFLIMGLIGVDKYFKSNKKTLLALSIFLITSTSYFFSIGAILSIIIYGIYVYLSKNKSIKFKQFIKDGIKFLFVIIIGIMMSSVLLIPTFITLLNGRAGGNININLLSLFLPNLNLGNYLYNSYTLGLTSIVIFSLLYGIIKLKKEKRFLSIMLLILITFPIFIYLLNGTLYINAKVLIPFLPVYILCISNMLDGVFTDKLTIKYPLIVYIIIILIFLLFNKSNYIYLFDFILLIIAFLILMKSKKEKVFIAIILIISFISFIVVNCDEKLVSREDVSVLPEVESLVNYIHDIDKSFYRISDRDGGLYTANNVMNIDTYQTTIYSSLSNQNYRNFYYNNLGNDILNRSNGQLSNPKNLLFNIYFGNKYIIGNETNELGYMPLKKENNKVLYLNKNVLPIGYSKSNLMSLDEFNKLKYPYNVEAIMNYVVVDKNVKSNYETKIEKTELEYDYNYENVVINRENNYISIESLNNGKITLDLKNKLTDKILFIRFDMLEANSCSIGDSYISINGVLNKLTCKGWKYNNQNTTFEYTISSKNLDKLSISLAKGKYKISNIETFTISYQDLVNGYSDYNSFEINREQTKGDVIEGTINVTKEGYFNLSVPYDKGFTIYLDNNKINFEKVDTAFIGFKINKGQHNIKIVYEAPAKTISKNISLIGILIFLGMIYIEQDPIYINKNKKKNVKLTMLNL